MDETVIIIFVVVLIVVLAFFILHHLEKDKELQYPRSRVLVMDNDEIIENDDEVTILSHKKHKGEGWHAVPQLHGDDVVILRNYVKALEN